MGLMREIYVASSDKSAREEARDHWVYFWERRGGGRSYGGHDQGGASTLLNTGRKQELLDMDRSIADGSFICGSPETVTRQIKEIATRAGADTFLGEFTFGALAHDQATQSLNLFIAEVMPALREFDVDALNYPAAEQA
jgi:alkanesulfonate monooxygenase SsuD/methylene tetrahydromethanopterin reductase-like flavin-dependent oxidoreductase (luciferase family)